MGSTSPCRRCLSQRDCLCARGCYWKDLALLGRDLAKTVALDHTIQGFPSQVAAGSRVGGLTCPVATMVAPWPALALSPQAANWIPVPRWFGDPGDEELLRLVPLLGQLCRAVRMGLGSGMGVARAVGHSPPPIPVSPLGRCAHRGAAAAPALQAAC